MNESKKRTQIRYAVLVFALVLVGQMSMQHVSFKAIALSAYENLANISSLSASVPPNPYNTLAVQIDQKEKELTAKEIELNQREQYINAKVAEESAKTRNLTLLFLGGVTVLLLLLIFLNFYFDLKREESREKESGTKHLHEFSTKI